MMASKLCQSASRICVNRVTPSAFRVATRMIGNSLVGTFSGFQPTTTFGVGANSNCKSIGNNNNNNYPLNQYQVRFRMTKAKRKRLIRHKRRAVLEEKGKELQKPPGYFPIDTVVENVTPRSVTQELIVSYDETDKAELEKRRAKLATQIPLRHHMTGLKMSDRVRRLFDMNNGNQKEVVQYQKLSGMSLFQMREGDTGSSGVQGMFYVKVIVFIVVPCFKSDTFSTFDYYFTVVALTSRIQQLQTHLRTHKKDKSTKRGLLKLTVRRRKLLDYLERKDFTSYRKVVKSLGLARR